MRLHMLAFFAAILVVLAGCGGSGSKENGNTSNSLVPEEYMTALRTAVESRDIDFIRNQISNNYMDDCENKEILVNNIMSTLGTSGTITFTRETITNKVVNLGLGTARFDGGFTIVVNDGGAQREYSQTGRMVLRRDNGPWQLYGEQDCEL